MTLGLSALDRAEVGAAADPWDNDPAVQEVLELRRMGIAAMTSGGATVESERFSTTFVANTPNNVVVTGEQMLERFKQGALSYESVEQRLDYAGSHGPDVVVLMGEEVVVPGPRWLGQTHDLAAAARAGPAGGFGARPSG